MPALAASPATTERLTFAPDGSAWFDLDAIVTALAKDRERLT